MSKRLNRFLKNLPESKAEAKGLDRGLVADLFGLSIAGGEPSVDANGNLDGLKKEKKRKKVGINDIPDKVLFCILDYLAQDQLKSVRLVSKRFNDIGTNVFRTIHTPILIHTEDRVFDFNTDLDKSFKFPFSRFRLILEPIKRHLLVTFVRAYDSHILNLAIEPFEKKLIKDMDYEDLPKQRLLFKLTGVLEELRAVEDLDIMYPSMSSFDYFELDFKVNFNLQMLKTLSIKFASSGFCKFSADLTMEILRNTVDLKKLFLRLPEPCNGRLESEQLRRVLSDAATATVPAISLTLNIDSNYNDLITTLIAVVANDENSRFTSLTFRFGPAVANYKDVLKLVRTCGRFLLALRLFRRLGGEGNISRLSTIRLPSLTALRYLEIESHRIPIQALDKDQFPGLLGCVLHLKFGNEQFYLRSNLHPLIRLKLHFHDTSILHHLIPETRMASLFSCHLTKLHLVNPPPEHLTFMGEWGGKIETLIIRAPNAYGQDPTYPLDKVLAQLRGAIQLRDYFPSHLQLLPKLVKLHLLFPINEELALYLAKMPKLWQLYVDDSKVSTAGVHEMRYHHVTYVSWRNIPSRGND